MKSVNLIKIDVFLDSDNDLAVEFEINEKYRKNLSMETMDRVRTLSLMLSNRIIGESVESIREDLEDDKNS